MVAHALYNYNTTSHALYNYNTTGAALQCGGGVCGTGEREGRSLSLTLTHALYTRTVQHNGGQRLVVVSVGREREGRSVSLMLTRALYNTTPHALYKYNTTGAVFVSVAGGGVCGAGEID